MEPNTRRWTAGKKTELVVSILKQDKTLVDACRENDLKQSKVKKWIEWYDEGRPHSALGYLSPSEFRGETSSIVVQD